MGVADTAVDDRAHVAVDDAEVAMAIQPSGDTVLDCRSDPHRTAIFPEVPESSAR